MPLTVSIIGDPQTGKHSFLGCLQDDTSSELRVRDFRNNCTLSFKFVVGPSDEAQFCMAVFDLTNRTTYESLSSHIGERQWEGVYIIGTKLDDEDARVVSYEEAQSFSQGAGYLYTEVSSITGKNVQMVLKMLKSRASKMILNN